MLYDLNQSFEYNLQHGPQFVMPYTYQKRRGGFFKILGYNVASPIGISACPLTANLRGITLCSRAGFDIITCKTIRSKQFPAHPFPNVTMLVPGNLQDTMIATTESPRNPRGRALANSIGNALGPFDETMAMLAQARRSLLTGQIMVVSVYGAGETEEEVVNDFVFLAQRVQEIGIHAVELNLSCPNVKGWSYTNREFVQRVVRSVKQVVAIPVTVKVGVFIDDQQARDIICAIAHAGAQGISGINSIPTTIYTKQGQPFFGESRARAGVSGAPIFEQALRWTKQVAEINEREQCGLTILGGGGIVTSADFDAMLRAGAHAAMTATGAMFDITLAIQWHEQDEDGTLFMGYKENYDQHNESII